jgi:hypothetical protein
MLIEKVKEALEGATPGPWVRDCWDILGKAKRHGGGTGHVCEVSGPNGPDDKYWENGEADANARLISLTPDMARKMIADEAKLIAAEEMKKALELMIAYCNAQPGTMGYPGTEAASALNAYRKAGEDNAD